MLSKIWLAMMTRLNRWVVQRAARQGYLVESDERTPASYLTQPDLAKGCQLPSYQQEWEILDAVTDAEEGGYGVSKEYREALVYPDDEAYPDDAKKDVVPVAMMIDFVTKEIVSCEEWERRFPGHVYRRQITRHMVA